MLLLMGHAAKRLLRQLTKTLAFVMIAATCILAQIIAFFIDSTLNELKKLKVSNTGIEPMYLKLEYISKFTVYLTTVFLFIILFLTMMSFIVSDKKHIALCKLLGYYNWHIVLISCTELAIISSVGYMLGTMLSIPIINFLIKPYFASKSGLDISFAAPLSIFAFPLITLVLLTGLICIITYLKSRSIYPVTLFNKDD